MAVFALMVFPVQTAPDMILTFVGIRFYLEFATFILPLQRTILRLGGAAALPLYCTRLQLVIANLATVYFIAASVGDLGFFSQPNKRMRGLGTIAAEECVERLRFFSAKADRGGRL